MTREALGCRQALIARASTQLERRRVIHVLKQVIDAVLLGMGKRRERAAVGDRCVGHKAGNLEGGVAQLVGMVFIRFGSANNFGVLIGGKRGSFGSGRALLRR
jgi:hypothetical protein